MKVNTGQNKQSRVLAGTGTIAGTSGTATSTTATSLTNTGASWTTNAWAGRYVVTPTRYAIAISNTGTVITLDQWIDPITQASGTTPSGTSTYVVFGEAPVRYMALTANTSAPSATDTALTGEITTAGGGLIRQAAAYAHTTDATTYTLTGSYTVNGSDTLGPIIHKIGTFDTLTPATGIMLHETVLSADATLSAVGDSLTVTQTVTM